MNNKIIDRADLPPVVQFWITEKEKVMGSECKKIWFFTNKLENRFLFGEFGDTIVTIAEYRGQSFYLEVEENEIPEEQQCPECDGKGGYGEGYGQPGMLPVMCGWCDGTGRKETKKST